jgi:translation initiation factor IF-2
MNVTVKNFDIIYELIDYLEKIVQGMIKVEEKEVHLGTMKVLAVFYKKEKDMII